MAQSAFVTGVAPITISSSQSSFTCNRPSLSPRPLYSNPPSLKNAPTKTAPKMAFSSLDTPEAAAVARDRDYMDLSIVVYQALRQVFGNSYISEHEYNTALCVPISQFLNKELNVKEFVRSLAKTSVYRERFFESASPSRFIELNYKHLLGRGVNCRQEISEHIIRLQEEGYEKDIDSYVDCEEYEQRFGNDTVPRFVFKGAYERNDDFNRLSVMKGAYEGCSTSTRTGSTVPRKPNGMELELGYGDHVGSFIKIKKGIPRKANSQGGVGRESFVSQAAMEFPANPRAPIRKRIKIVDNLYQVVEFSGVTAGSGTSGGSKEEPEWMKTAGKQTKKYNGQWF